MNKTTLENLNQLSSYLNEAVLEAFTTHDTLDKYQRLIDRYAQKASIDPQVLNQDLDDFKALYEQIVADSVVTEFEEKSLIAQGKLAYIREDTVKKLLNAIKSNQQEIEHKVILHEVRIPRINGQVMSATLSNYIKKDQEFVHKDDVICILSRQGKTYLVSIPVSGSLNYIKAVGEEIPFDGIICEISEDNKSGQFEYNWYDGTQYFGDFQDGKISGNGQFKYQNGDFYEGEVLNSQRHGQGTLKYANGDIYSGEFKENNKNGKGKINYANGDVYEGEFLNDKREGKGIYKYINDNQYEGDWVEDKMYGEGTFIIINQKEFVLFETYQMYQGKAKYLLPNEDFALGFFYGGIFFNQLEKESTYDSNPIRSIPSQQGYSINLPSDYPKSTLITNKPAEYHFKNGNIYVGSFHQGLFQGEGQMIFSAGNYPMLDGAEVMSYKGMYDQGELKGEVMIELLEAHKSGISRIKTFFIEDKFLAEIVPFAHKYEGDIKNGQATVYLTQTPDKNPSNKPGVFIAQFNNYKPIGSISFENSNYTYKGEMQNLKLHGQGTLIHGEFKWEGTFENNYLIVGKAYKKVPQGWAWVYEGGFGKFYVSEDYLNNPDSLNQGTYHGKGKYIYGTSRLEGEFIYGNLYDGFVSNLEIDIELVLLNQSPQRIEGKYDGEIKEGLASGEGIFNSKNIRLEGTFKHGTLLKGKVQKIPYRFKLPFLQIEKAAEGLYSGEYPDGKVVIFFDQEAVKLEGKLKNGIFSQGKIIYSDYIVEGEFKEAQAIGKVKFTDLKKGFVYEGELQGTQFHGQGKITYEDGTYYNGYWEESKKHGYGAETNSLGELYEGQFHQDVKQGFGKLTLKNGDIYEGHFKNNLFNGEGSLMSTNGDVYRGAWKDGKKHGEGTQVLAEEDQTITGLWEEDELVKDYNKKSLWDKMFGKE